MSQRQLFLAGGLVRQQTSLALEKPERQPYGALLATETPFVAQACEHWRALGKSAPRWYLREQARELARQLRLLYHDLQEPIVIGTSPLSLMRALEWGNVDARNASWEIADARTKAASIHPEPSDPSLVREAAASCKLLYALEKLRECLLRRSEIVALYVSGLPELPGPSEVHEVLSAVPVLQQAYVATTRLRLFSRGEFVIENPMEEINELFMEIGRRLLPPPRILPSPKDESDRLIDELVEALSREVETEVRLWQRAEELKTKFSPEFHVRIERAFRRIIDRRREDFVG